ncbi:MAG: hypothetical protein NT004_02810 [Bacteroidetes bacterium]|nr:hypothetical protein [Bacteroidota bacterium]
MKIILHPHALRRAIERGAIEEEIFQTVTEGEQFPAKFSRTGFRLNFHFENLWSGHFSIPNKLNCLQFSKMKHG